MPFTRDDVRNPVHAVLSAYVFDNVAAPAFAKVHVEVGRRNALEREHSFEKQIEAYRLDVGDFDKVCNHAARAAASTWAHGDAVGSRPVDEVVHDKEVVYKARAHDNRKFVVELVAQELRPVGGLVGLGNVGFGMVVVYAVAFHHALFREVEKQKPVFHKLPAAFGRKGEVVGLAVLAQNFVLLFYVKVENAVEVRFVAVVLDVYGLLVFGIVVHAHRNFDVNALRKLDGVVESLVQFGEKRLHFRARFDVKFRVRIAHSLRVGNERARVYAKHGVVRVGVLFIDVMAVVGGYHLQPELARELYESGENLLVGGQKE